MLDTISLEVPSQLFRQIRLLLLGTHIQLLRLDGKVARIFPVRKHPRTRGLTHLVVMQVQLEVLHLPNMAPRGGLQQDLMHHPHIHRLSILCLRIPRRRMNRRRMHSPRMHQMDMHHLDMHNLHMHHLIMHHLDMHHFRMQTTRHT